MEWIYRRICNFQNGKIYVLKIVNGLILKITFISSHDLKVGNLKVFFLKLKKLLNEIMRLIQRRTLNKIDTLLMVTNYFRLTKKTLNLISSLSIKRMLFTQIWYHTHGSLIGIFGIWWEALEIDSRGTEFESRGWWKKYFSIFLSCTFFQHSRYLSHRIRTLYKKLFK